MSSRQARRSSRSRSANIRDWLSHVEGLEARQMLSTLPVSRPMYQVAALVSNTNPPSGAYTPAQVRQAYQFDQVSFNGVAGDGAGQTIAIVDAYDAPNIQADLDAFDARFGLPATAVTRVDQGGGTSYPSADSSGGWELEESLDVEWAHAMAPGARILLVEAASPNDSDLLAAVGYAAQHAGVVSMSWGGGEFSGEASYDSDFSRPGVAFVASSGDNGAPISWPAASPDVLAVGGTALTLSGGSYAGETGWSGSGGGPSAYEAMPSYQSGAVTATTMRANPDVAYDGDPSTGYAVYDSYQYNGSSYGWMQLGGTSAGAPQWAAILAIADEGRALAGRAAVDASGAQEVMATLYRNPGDFHDVTGGTSTGSPHYGAGSGYDYVTGLGSPMVNLVIGSLDGTSTATPPDSIAVSAPASATAGSSFTVTITAEKAGGTAVDTGYTGTVGFTSSDGQITGLPGSYTFTAADKGVHTFTVTLKTAGSQKITETSASGSASSTIAVSPAAASQLVIAGLSSTATAGAAQTFTVTARDPYGNVATGYTGTVHFASSDGSATLPGSYTFTTADKGVHTFNVTFATAGSQSLTVSDASNLSASQSGISVSPAAPLNLAATAVSSSQVNLAWGAAAGAGGYEVERGSGSSWVVIATTPAGTTSYSDTGLAAGTTYSYRVIATASGGGFASAPSNTAVATTTGTPPSPVGSATDSLWSNSYTPSENAYSWGSYELGMRFQSSVGGQVTGVRFYKQTWMGGYIHVGHLWSSSGALLASVAFTNETSYGWEQANFSGAVTIQPNTTYIVSFSTGGGYFGITSGYFKGGGVTSGPLTAPGGGNGVYQSAGRFPSVNGSGMNFWVDVAFSPTSPSVRTASASAPASGTTGRAGYLVSTTTGATPSGPAGVASASRGTTAPTAGYLVGTASSRRAVTQAQQPVLWGSRRSGILA